MHYKVYESELSATYQILWHPDCSRCRDKVNGAAGRLRQLADGALFFARHLDYFIVTQNFQPLPGLGTVKTIYHDPKLIVHLSGLPDARSARSGQVQKTRHRDADANSLNRRAVSIQA